MSIPLFNLEGEAVAFVRHNGDNVLFNAKGSPIGWFAWQDDDVATWEGEYLGTVEGDRLLRKQSPGFRSSPGFPPNKPMAESPPWNVSRAGRAGTSWGYEDVPDRFLLG